MPISSHHMIYPHKILSTQVATERSVAEPTFGFTRGEVRCSAAIMLTDWHA
jgi:hypothetical protein